MPLAHSYVRLLLAIAKLSYSYIGPGIGVQYLIFQYRKNYDSALSPSV